MLLPVFPFLLTMPAPPRNSILSGCVQTVLRSLPKDTPYALSFSLCDHPCERARTIAAPETAVALLGIVFPDLDAVRDRVWPSTAFLFLKVFSLGTPPPAVYRVYLEEGRFEANNTR